MYHHTLKNDEFADKYIFKGKKNGYFVEVGACSGISYSQCYYFEKELNWDGIAVEPDQFFHETLTKNRKTVCFKCLGNKNELVSFSESKHKGLSGVTNILYDIEKKNPTKTGWRDNGFKEYMVECTTLLDMLKEYNSPPVIDFLGMDCEGSEYNILEHYFNNNKEYLIKFMSLEVGRKDLVDLVKKNGYIELINPLLPLYNGKKVNWERYFIHYTEINNVDKTIIM